MCTTPGRHPGGARPLTAPLPARPTFRIPSRRGLPFGSHPSARLRAASAGGMPQGGARASEGQGRARKGLGNSHLYISEHGCCFETRVQPGITTKIDGTSIPQTLACRNNAARCGGAPPRCPHLPQPFHVGPEDVAGIELNFVPVVHEKHLRTHQAAMCSSTAAQRLVCVCRR